MNADYASSGYFVMGAKARLLFIAERWDELASKARDLDWGNSILVDVAKRCGTEWKYVLGNQTITYFLSFDGERLLGIPGFGPKKATKLCDILAQALEIRKEDSSFVISFEYNPEPCEFLPDWDIPNEFPCHLCIIPVRVLNYCEAQGIYSLGQLLDEWRNLGFEGFKKIRNLGTKSIREVEALINAIENRDIGVVSQFLPLNPSGSCLSFSASLALAVRIPSSVERVLLKRRLIERLTLEESAAESGVTRERVRQIEAGFLKEIKARLDYFASDRDALLHAWINGKNWSELLLPLEDAELAIGAIESIFEETPEACARNLGREAKWEEWREAIRTHPALWFGGVNLDDFLSDRVPTDQTDDFFECMTSCRDFRLDHFSGKVSPTKTGLYSSVLAMLTLEDDPVPLTWLVELLLQTGYHPTITKQTLKRNRRNWLTRADFPKDKIIWTE